MTNTVIQPGERAVHRTVKDPTKPVGYRFFNNEAVNGAKVWTTVTIYDHGKLHWQKRYFSNYPAVDGVTVVGTGDLRPAPRRGRLARLGAGALGQKVHHQGRPLGQTRTGRRATWIASMPQNGHGRDPEPAVQEGFPCWDGSSDWPSSAGSRA